MAVLLLVLALFVLFSEFKYFFNFFFQQPPLFKEEDRPDWLNKIQRAKFVIIPFVVLGWFGLTYTLKNKVMGHNEFYGAWEIENKENWDRIYFQAAHTFSIKKGCELTEAYRGKYTFDEAASTWVRCKTR